MIRERLDLSGKVALVIGGRGYLGQRFCAALAECGARVYSADQRRSSRATAPGPAVPGRDITQRTVDVRAPRSVDALVRGVLSETPQVDVLVYSVTAKPKDFYAPFTECSLAGWQAVLRAELDGLFLVAQRVGGAMERSGSGSIILLSSIYGVVGNDQRIYEGANLARLYAGVRGSKRIYSHAAYAAAKGAVIALTRFLAAYWGGRGIRVNCVSPGGVAHPGEDRGFVQRYAARVPLGRKAAADEISGAVVYLASDASSYVTGHNLVVDGGWTAW